MDENGEGEKCLKFNAARYMCGDFVCKIENYHMKLYNNCNAFNHIILIHGNNPRLLLHRANVGGGGHRAMWSIWQMCLMCVCICVIDYVFNIKLEMFIICHCVDYMDVIKAKAIFRL